MKAFLWCWTLLGLFPLVAFAALHLFSILHARAVLPNEASQGKLDGNYITISRTTIKFDGFRDPLILHSYVLPAVLCLVGATTVIVGLLYLIPTQPIRTTKAGYAKLTTLVPKVLKSKKRFASLIISARDGNKCVAVSRKNDEISIGITIDATDIDELNSVREYFARNALDPASDYETHDEQFDVTMVHLEYVVGSS